MGTGTPQDAWNVSDNTRPFPTPQPTDIQGILWGLIHLHFILEDVMMAVHPKEYQDWYHCLMNLCVEGILRL